MSQKYERQLRAFAEHTVDLVSEQELRAKLERGAPLRIKQGFDPSAPDLHLKPGSVNHDDRRRVLRNPRMTQIGR